MLQATSTVTTLTPPAQRTKHVHESVIIRSMPSFIFLYPTVIATFIMALLVNRMPQHDVTITRIFLVILFCNMVVLAIDFPRSTAFGFASFAAFLVLSGWMIDWHLFHFLPGASNLLFYFKPTVNDEFYLLFGLVMTFIFVIVLLFEVRWDYWQIMPNEIVHHHGPMDSTQRFPAPGVHLQKDITDIFEHILLRSGRLILQPERGSEIVLENVPFVNSVEEKIQKLLESLSVMVNSPHQEQPK